MEDTMATRNPPPPPAPKPKESEREADERDDENESQSPREALAESLDAISEWVAVAREALDEIEEPEEEE
jgi:hypothetical protein